MGAPGYNIGLEIATLVARDGHEVRFLPLVAFVAGICKASCSSFGDFLEESTVVN